MEVRRLGRTELEVSRISLGCGNFGGIGSAPELFGQGETIEEAFALMDAAAEAGITVLDTAASYGGGRSETWVGRWRAERGADVLLSTKVYWSVTGDPDDHGLSYDRIMREIEGSLGRLQAERIDMYLTHEPDPETPIEETLRALDELVRSGKIRAFGASNLDGAQLEEALETSERLGLARLEWVQNEYSLLAARPRGRRASHLRARRPRLHAVQPARGRLADRQVPARRGVPVRLADDPSPRAVLGARDTSARSMRSRRSRRPPQSAAWTRRPSRSRGCWATRR